jgi:hypothetical protein
MDIVDKARQWCKTVRTNPTPLSEAIPMVAKLCDEAESLRNQLAECQKDAERWNYFIETCSEETAFELTGITGDVSNEQINEAIDSAMSEKGIPNSRLQNERL